jgi:hypothetical protein
MSFEQVAGRAESANNGSGASPYNMEDVTVVPPSSRDAQEIVKQTTHDVLSSHAIKKRIVEKEHKKMSSNNEISKEHLDGQVAVDDQDDRTASMSCYQCCCRRDIFWVIIMVLLVWTVAGTLFTGVLYMTIAMGVSALYVYFGLFLMFIIGIILAVNVNKVLKADAKRNAEIMRVADAAATVRANKQAEGEPFASASI